MPPPDPATPLLFPEMVQLSMTRDPPTMSIPPPYPPLVFAVIVLLSSVRKLLAVMLIAPPNDVVLFPEKTTLSRVTLAAELLTTKPAPGPVFPPLTVTPEMLSVGAPELKIRKLVAAAGSRRTVRSDAPGPLIVSAPDAA